MVTPGSNTVDATIRRDGQMQALESMGATVLANACGPCIGQWQREDVKKGETNTIVTSFNRNFSGRSGPGSLYLASPLTVAASAVMGTISAYRPGMFAEATASADA